MKAAMPGRIRIGISGWRYAPWRGVFYPPGLRQQDELAFAAGCFAAIELNGSFYSLQTPASWAAWREATPPDFAFAVKGPRYLTHALRLRDIEVPLANFLASGVLTLGEKLGPLLWQFPPRQRFDAARFEAFFALLPRDTQAAARFAARHRDARVEGRSAFDVDAPPRPLRHAVEIRHESFVEPVFVALLREHGIALVVADTAGRWPDREDVTAGHVYVRLHGAEELYASGYDAASLDRWAEKIRAWAAGGEAADARLTVDAPPPPASQGREVWCFFDNDIKVRAPFDAQSLMQRLGVLSPAPSAASPAPRRRSARSAAASRKSRAG